MSPFLPTAFNKGKLARTALRLGTNRQLRLTQNMAVTLPEASFQLGRFLVKGTSQAWLESMEKGCHLEGQPF